MSRFDPLFRTHMQEIFTEITDYTDTKANKVQETWIVPTLLNGWINAGAPEENAGYYKDNMGTVHLKGTVKNGLATQWTSIFVLLAGYLPNFNQGFAINSNLVSGIAYVTQGGSVQFAVGSNVSFSLNGITFKAGV